MERGSSATGATLSLIVPFESSPSGEKPINISFLLAFPMLCEPVAEAIVTRARIAASPFVTVDGWCSQLKNGLIKFLGIKYPNAALADITTAVLDEFIAWLRRSENGGRKYKTITMKHFLMVSTTTLEFLQKSDRWKDFVSPELSIRKNYWAGQDDDRNNVTLIPEEVYRDIYIACKNEITATMAKVREHRRLMQAQLDHPTARQGDIYPSHAYYPSGKFNPKVWRANPYNDLGLCLAALRHRVPGVILSITDLIDMQDKMLLRVVEGTQPFGSIPQLHYCFYPYIRDLVPFILMLAIHLDYNPETLLTSELRDYVIRTNEIGSLELVASPSNVNVQKKAHLESKLERETGELEILARAKKGRSNNAPQPQIRPATDDPDNPASIIKFLCEWTTFIRPLAAPVHKARQFIYVTEQGTRGIRAFDSGRTAGSDGSWRNALKRFYIEHKIPHTAFNRFRTTGLDFSDGLFGGDIRAKQAAGNHASPETGSMPFRVEFDIRRHAG